MGEVLNFIIECLSNLVIEVLSWKILDNFSYLHLVLGLALLGMLISFLTFGYSWSGGASDYMGVRLRQKRNIENRKDKEYYKLNYGDTYIYNIGERNKK